MKRRRFLQLLGGSATGIVALSIPIWARYTKALPRSTAAPIPPLVAVLPDPSQPAPGPLPTQSTPDGRPVTHNLDIGRLSQIQPDFAVLNSGIGPRLLRFSPNTTVWLEGSEYPYSPDLLADFDWAEAEGTTLEDYSMNVSHLKLNSLGNLIGVFSGLDGSTMSAYVRSGREAGSYSDSPTTISFDKRLEVFSGRGTFHTPNRTVVDIPVGSWIMCEGYRSRDGTSHALRCYIGNELPPTDVPAWLLDKLPRPR